MRFACAVLRCLWPVRLYNIFHIISYTARISKDMLLNTKCVFGFSLQRLSDTFFTLRRTERYIYWSSCNVPLVILDFNKTLIFLTNSQKIVKYRFSIKLVQWEPSCSIQTDGRMDGRTDRQTDMMKLIVFCLGFANASKIIFQEWNRMSVLWSGLTFLWAEINSGFL